MMVGAWYNGTAFHSVYLFFIVWGSTVVITDLLTLSASHDN